MSGEMEKEVWKLHDSRLNEHEKRFTEGARSFQAIEDQLKYLIGRIDNGVSKTQQEILHKDNEIEKQLITMNHRIDMDLLKVNEKIDTGYGQLRDSIAPLEARVSKMNNIYIYSIVAGMIMGLVVFGMQKVLGKIEHNNDSIAQVENLKALPFRHKN